jgi:hypothetical protein
MFFSVLSPIYTGKKPWNLPDYPMVCVKISPCHKLYHLIAKFISGLTNVRESSDKLEAVSPSPRVKVKHLLNFSKCFSNPKAIGIGTFFGSP